MIVEQYNSITVEAGSVGETGFPCFQVQSLTEKGFYNFRNIVFPSAHVGGN